MKHTITIETQSDSDFILIKSLAERLGLRVNEQHNSALTDAERQTLLERVSGGWAGQETGNELVEMIYSARRFNHRDVQL
jgi:hypothetical protein